MGRVRVCWVVAAAACVASRGARARSCRFCPHTHTHTHPTRTPTTHNSAPIDPASLIKPEQLDDHDPSKVLVITTGSQAEPRAQLCMAAQQASHYLKLAKSDLLLYSAKVRGVCVRCVCVCALCVRVCVASRAGGGCFLVGSA